MYPRHWRDLDEVPEDELRDWIDAQRENDDTENDDDG